MTRNEKLKGSGEGREVWVTEIYTGWMGEEDLARLTETLKYCEEHDRDGDFKYAFQDGETLVIYSPTRDKAYKRGMYLHKKFKVYFEVKQVNL